MQIFLGTEMKHCFKIIKCTLCFNPIAGLQELANALSVNYTPFTVARGVKLQLLIAKVVDLNPDMGMIR